MILLVIDMQKGLVDEDLYAFDTFIKRTAQLVDIARKNNVEVVFVQHDAGPASGMSVGEEAFEIIDEIAPKEGEKVFIKTINSCFGNRDFKEYLKQQTDKRLMIIGLQTNYCIDATVKSAFERGYDVIIPEGTNSTFDNDYMSGETTVKYYNEDVWEELVHTVTFEESIEILEKPQTAICQDTGKPGIAEVNSKRNKAGKYKVITLCGSTRFKDSFLEAQKRLTLEGNIVISVGLFGHSGDSEVWNEGIKEMLDDMHKRKIDMADEIYVVNVGGYIGSSTKSEIEYAISTGKTVSYLEPMC